MLRFTNAHISQTLQSIDDGRKLLTITILLGKMLEIGVDQTRFDVSAHSRTSHVRAL
jgi:hypothetical protein